MREANDYRDLYETERKRNTEIGDSLMVVEARVEADKVAVKLKQAELDSLGSGAKSRLRRENLKNLATFYSKIKAQQAADIMQVGTLGDTTVAMLMRLLPPQQMAKIMQAMTPDFAANITKMMEELKQDAEPQQ
jgi:flagellar motility protein MotE (MotC chaperone)